MATNRFVHVLKPAHRPQYVAHFRLMDGKIAVERKFAPCFVCSSFNPWPSLITRGQPDSLVKNMWRETWKHWNEIKHRWADLTYTQHNFCPHTDSRVKQVHTHTCEKLGGHVNGGADDRTAYHCAGLAEAEVRYLGAIALVELRTEDHVTAPRDHNTPPDNVIWLRARHKHRKAESKQICGKACIAFAMVGVWLHD